MNKYLAIDIGGTFIKYGEYFEDGTELSSGRVSTPKNPEDFLDKLTELILQHKELCGVAVSCPGFINPETGENSDYSIGENIKKYNLKVELNKRTNLRTAVENDGKCAALAESWLGRGRDCSDIIVVTLGTGVGGGIITNKQLFRGSNFKAGEFGFMRIGRDEKGFVVPPATSGLVKAISRELGKEVTGEYIFENYEDEKIQAIYREWLEKVAMTIGNLAVCFDAEMVLVGGGISASDIFIRDLKEKVYSCYSKLQDYTLIDRCLLKNNAGKIGALYNYLKHYKVL